MTSMTFLMQVAAEEKFGIDLTEILYPRPRRKKNINVPIKNFHSKCK